MKTFRRTLSFALAMCLLLSCAGFTSYEKSDEQTADGSSEYAEGVTIEPYSKLSFIHSGKAETPDSVSDCENLLNEMGRECGGRISILVQYESGFDRTEQFLKFQECRSKIRSVRELRQFRQELNAYSLEYNKNLFKSMCDLFSFRGSGNIQEIRYAPFAYVEGSETSIDISDYLALAESSKILSVAFFSPLQQSEDSNEMAQLDVSAVTAASWEQALEVINFFEPEYTGEGVRVGISEGYNCDTDNENLTNADITLDEPSHATGTHATLVTSILALMCPDAEFYLSDEGSSLSTENDGCHLGLQWFIDQQCDVVNCSFGISGSSAYSTIDALYDYQIQHHFLSAVVSAGNTGNYITSPGHAYNAITVGGVTLSTDGRVTHRASSAYQSSGNAAKPTISAMACFSVPNIAGSFSGTSIAAPMVTAAAVLLIDKDVHYASYPEKIAAALIASAQLTDDYTNDYGYVDNEVGSGCLNVETLLYEIDSDWAFDSTTTMSAVVESYTCRATAGQTIQVGMTLLVPMQNTSACDGIRSYEIWLYKDDVLLARSSSCDYRTSELIRYTVTESGSYTIKIYRSSPRYYGFMTDYLGVAKQIY